MLINRCHHPKAATDHRRLTVCVTLINGGPCHVLKLIKLHCVELASRPTRVNAEHRGASLVYLDPRFVPEHRHIQSCLPVPRNEDAGVQVQSDRHVGADRHNHIANVTKQGPYCSRQSSAVKPEIGLPLTVCNSTRMPPAADVAKLIDKCFPENVDFRRLS